MFSSIPVRHVSTSNLLFASFFLCAMTPFVIAGEPFSSRLLVGTWRIDSYVRNGVIDKEMSGGKVEFTVAKMIFASDGKENEIRYSLGSGDPIPINCKQQWDELDKDFVLQFQGIIEANDDTITYCFPTRTDGPRPTVFESTKTNRQTVMRLSRIK